MTASNLPVPATPALSPQDELFVELYRETGDAMASAVRAKMFSPDYPIDVLARKTLDRPEIQAAIDTLDQAERVAAAKAPRPPVEVTKDTIIANLQAVVESALPEKAYGAVVAATKTQASILGVLRQTVDVNFHHKRAEDMTDEELERIIKQNKATDADFEEVRGE